MRLCAGVLFVMMSCIFLPLHAQNDSACIIIAHRGGPCDSLPENSISAIKESIKKGVSRIEIDVHQTKDSVLVVIHDLTVDRTTSGTGIIKDRNWAELKKFDLDANEGIPLLEDVIKQVNGACSLVIELKKGNEYYPGIEKRTVDMINKYDARNWCIVQSFDDEILDSVHAVDSTITLNKIFIAKLCVAPVVIDYTLRFRSLKSYTYVDEFSVNQYFAGRLLIKRVHKLGKKINAWNVNDDKKKQRLIKRGIDGIITDFP